MESREVAGAVVDNARDLLDGPVPPAIDSDREGALHRYLELLTESGSPLVSSGGQTVELVSAQFYAVFDAVSSSVVSGAAPDEPAAPPVPPAPPATEDLSEKIGRSRAVSNIHPSQSLHAATLIFEAALPTIAARLAAAGDPQPELTAGLLLNKEILSRMATAARAYVDLLLDKAQSTNRDERLRLSRELHDVAAPAVAIGLQNLELFDLYSKADPDRAAAKLQAARQSLLDALATIRGLSTGSREAVGSNGLAVAIRRYLDMLNPALDRSVTVCGDLDTVPLSYAEELFLIVREAIRNAIDHGQASSVSVDFELLSGRLVATVSDNGGGFAYSPQNPPTGGMGIASMHERADLIGATLAIRSAPGKGAEVRVEISLPPMDDSPGAARSTQASRAGQASRAAQGSRAGQGAR